MEKEIKLTTKLDEYVYRKAYFDVTRIKKRLPWLIILYVNAILAGFFLFIPVQTKDMGAIFGYIVFLGVFMFIIVFNIIILPKIQYNSKSVLYNMIYEYIFNDEEFTIVMISSGSKSSSSIKYEKLNKVRETKNNIIIYVTINQFYIIDKKQCDKNIEEVTKLLKSKVKKYKMN